MPKLGIFAVLVAYCTAAVLFSGCRNSLSTQYGLSDGTDAKYSPASVSLFRNLCNAEGRSTLVVRSLSPGATKKLQAIVWSPDTFEIHEPETFAWMDRWLSLGDRTLVYVGRDFSPTADYWSQSAETFSSGKDSYRDALFAREQQASEMVQLDLLRSRARIHVPTPWCMMDYSRGSFEQVTDVKGPWSDSLDASRARLFLRSFPTGYSAETLTTLQKDFDWKPEDTSSTPVKPIDYGPEWQKSDQTMLELIKSIQDADLPQIENLLSTENDRGLISEITMRKWGSSRVILLSNASLISNLSLINNENLSLAKKIVAELPQKNIGFLAGSMDPRIRKDDNSDQQKGFEMLTIWPLNVISIHAVFLGMLVLLSAFPVFGRAKQLPAKSSLEFGQHIEAVGSLLFKSRDRFYALSTISEYFRNVRKEPTSPWANADPSAMQEPKSPFQG